MEQCIQVTEDGPCHNERLDPQARTWRLLALHRNMRPLLVLCEDHAEQRIMMAERAQKNGGFWGQRGVLYDFMRSQPQGRWVTTEELALGLYGVADEAECNAIRSLVHRMRRHGIVLEGRRGHGYRLRATDPAWSPERQQIQEAS